MFKEQNYMDLSIFICVKEFNQVIFLMYQIKQRKQITKYGEGRK